MITTAFILLPMFYPTFTFSMLGFSYAIFGSVIWPTVAYIVPSKNLVIYLFLDIKMLF